MTDNVPAIPDHTPTREIATTDTDSWIPVASDVIRLANLIAPTEFVPKGLRDSAPATAAAILYGREVGLPPMTALTMTHVIEGRPAMSAEAMRGLILAAGHDLDVVETSRARCVLRGRRYGQERWTEVAVEIGEFRHLANKQNWQNYPRQMLQARATAELARLVFPDVIHGFRAIEELDDVTDEGPSQAAFPAAQGTRKVARGRKPAAALPAGQRQPLETPAARPAPSGPPLPGEAGYEDTTRGAEAPTGQPAGGDSTSEGEASEEPPAAGDRPPDESVGGSSGTDSPVVGGVEGAAGEQPVEGAGPGGSVNSPAEAPPAKGPRKASRAQHRMIHAQLAELEVTEEDRHWITGAIVGRPVESFNDLTSGDASKIVDTLARCKSRADLDVVLEAAGGES